MGKKILALAAFAAIVVALPAGPGSGAAGKRDVTADKQEDVTRDYPRSSAVGEPCPNGDRDCPPGEWCAIFSFTTKPVCISDKLIASKAAFSEQDAEVDKGEDKTRDIAHFSTQRGHRGMFEPCDTDDDCDWGLWCRNNAIYGELECFGHQKPGTPGTDDALSQTDVSADKGKNLTYSCHDDPDHVPP